MGHPVEVAGAVLVFCLSVLSKLLADWWISQWTGETISGMSGLAYAGVYAGFLVFLIVTTAGRGFWAVL